MWKLMLLAGAGGFVGTCCRFLVNRLFLVYYKAPFPLATFTINVVGCFLFGLLFALLNRNGILPPKMNALLITGFCGGFTTFSTFSFESLTLGFNGTALISLSYIIASVVVGLIASWLGLQLIR